MLTRLKKAQATAEYAILFALVVGAAMTVQNYVKKSLQARVYDATEYYATNTPELGATRQWEPGRSIKTTEDQKSKREFTEDYTNADEPFTYKESMEADFKSTSTQ